MFTLTAIVPAFNEQEGLPETLEALLSQIDPLDEIIVLDDCSTDRTREIALSYGVTVITPAHNLGSKAKAQNYALQYVTTDLVLPVDADTTLAPNYTKLIKEPFSDPDVVIAAGCVQTKYTNTKWEKGRSTEYLYGFHWHRPIQNSVNSIMVCSGCCSAFRSETLIDFGGFPERTIVEDMDYTWTQQIAGKKAVYVANAEAWAADPSRLKYLRKQMWRWEAGFFQNVRLHFKDLWLYKRWLAIWVSLALFEIITAPIYYLAPLLGVALGLGIGMSMLLFFGLEVLLIMPPLIYGARKRRIPMWKVLVNLPFVYLNRVVNIIYAWKAMIYELVLVPLGIKDTFSVYEKGRA